MSTDPGADPGIDPASSPSPRAEIAHGDRMRAARLHRIGEPLVLDTISRPTPGPGQVLVKVLACGVCHPDLHACRGDWRARPKLPLIPGHEIVGEIIGGENAGQRVGVFWLNSACGSCEYCTDAWESLCPAQVNTGF